MVLSLGAGHAQNSSTVSLDNGVQVHIEAKFGQPTGQEVLTVEMTRASGNSFYRVFRDQNQLAVYAYILMLDLAANGTAVHATAKAYDAQFMERFPNADGGKPTPTLSADREAGPLGNGQSADIDLFEIPGMGLNVNETIAVKIDQRPAAGALRFSGLRVSINGKTMPGAQQAEVSGRHLMFYVPGRGGYFFSAQDPGHGFVKAGVVNGNRMQFSLDNENYECIANAPILTDAPSSELWVWHDAGYKPAGNFTAHLRSGGSELPAEGEFFVAASDSLSWWLP